MSDIKTNLKVLFRSGAMPSERDFAKLIDSMVSTDDFENTIASLRDTPAKQADIQDADRRREELAILRREKDELEARLDREIAMLRAEKGTIEPLLRRNDLVNRREIEAASTFLEHEISALKDERRTLRDRQDREIETIRRGVAYETPPIVSASSASLPSASKSKPRQVPADGAWHLLDIEPRIGAFTILVTISSTTNVAATVAAIVAAGPTLRPSVQTRQCYDHGLWIILVPAGMAVIGIGAGLIWSHGFAVWREPWSAAGLWLSLVGIGAILAGIVLRRRRCLSIVWRRRDGFFARTSPGMFYLKSNSRFMPGEMISYIVSAIDDSSNS